MNISLQAFIQ